MLKTIGSTGFAANPKETKGKISCNSMVSNMVDGGEATNPTKRKNYAKTTMFKILVKTKNHDFPKSRTEEAGTGLSYPQSYANVYQIKASICRSPNSSPF